MTILHARKTLLTLALAATFIATLLVAPIVARPVQAQDGAMIECDTTLVTLLIVAEKDYDYLSDMMMKKEPLPNIDYGPHEKLVKGYIAMMIKMAGGDSSMMMTEDANMMMTEDPGMMMTEEPGMMMTEGSGMMMHSGDVVGEDPACATIRADVEKFLIDHMMADMAKAGM